MSPHPERTMTCYQAINQATLVREHFCDCTACPCHWPTGGPRLCRYCAAGQHLDWQTAEPIGHVRETAP